MRRLAQALVAAAALSAALPGASAAATATGWIDVTLEEIRTHRTTPPRAARALALVSVAIERASRGRDGADAVDGAAAAVLTDLFPDGAPAFADWAREDDPSPDAFARGRALGRRVARRARSDGSTLAFAGEPPTGDAFWVPTPPLFLPPLEALAGTWRPWNLRSGDELRPPEPPRPGSARFAAELEEVRAVAAGLTSEQRRIAFRWADGPGSDTPPGHWNRIAIRLIGAARLPLAATARMLATLNTAQADAFIAAWDAKYAYWSMRPVTAMRRLVDPGWRPLFATPAFPGYVSGHSTTSGAAATVLARFFPARAARLRRWAEESAESRLFAGIHFRSDNEAGLELGRRVARIALKR